MAYASGKRKYLSFCTQFHYKPLPVEESTLLRFVAFLFSLSLSYSSIRLYLCAVRHLQIMGNLPDPALTAFPKLNYALRGLRREGPRLRTCPRLPITPELLRKIYQVWSQRPKSYNQMMLWAAFCLGFFALLRSGEFTCSSWEAYTPDMLSPGDISVDSHAAPSHVAIHLKRSKNHPFAVGTILHLGITGDVLCPVTSMLGYLAIRPLTPGPLFLFEDGCTLSRPKLVHFLRQALQAAGVDDSCFSGHSFRISAATTAAKMGLSDSLIKTLGRWKSSAFESYIRTPQQQLAAVSATLIGTHTII